MAAAADDDAAVEELAIGTALVEEATAAAIEELTGALPVQPSPGTVTSWA